ncbi:TPA: polyprenyl synthetase family protein [archaeon]|uniref:Polyprenyl synthetase family protein n=1 Tax=Candidatus Naiadarchaeum limnaeum TaxID=2756139 RepID=A0A832V0A7_9ARCH|nr:polyprenyl synthetase family protein [Candidatus Naiadarchaeales archaeon SRR2090153.bin1042]HIJ99937.1 polyprenyl synthetase family protein [Candidatus Naiadarchaeum limnaeum]
MQIKIEQVLNQKAKKVDFKIFEFIDKYISKGLRKPITYLFKSGGKRIRPSIAMLAAELICSDADVALYPAVSCEIVHAASLIYDDIIDRATKRRHKKPIHLRWNYPTAILAGNQLLSLAIKVLALDPKSKSTSFSDNIDLFSNAWMAICDGKFLGAIGAFDRVTDEQVLDIIYKKTAVLFELAAKTGAIYAGADRNAVNALASYGKNVGMAFQIQDDILGILGNEKVLGKDVGSDIKEGKKTLLVSYVLNNGSTSYKKKLLHYLGDPNLNKEDLELVNDIFVNSGGVDHAKNYAYKFSQDAISCLDVLEDSKDKKYLAEISQYVVERLK